MIMALFFCVDYLYVKQQHCDRRRKRNTSSMRRNDALLWCPWTRRSSFKFDRQFSSCSYINRHWGRYIIGPQTIHDYDLVHLHTLPHVHLRASWPASFLDTARRFCRSRVLPGNRRFGWKSVRQAVREEHSGPLDHWYDLLQSMDYL